MIIFWIIGLNKNIADLFLFFYVASTDGYKAALLVKNTPANAGDMCLVPDPGRSHMLRSN